jgi:hypothetical protein
MTDQTGSWPDEAPADEGFIDIEQLMGEDFVAPLWPQEHRRSVPVVESDGTEDTHRWFIRSPWPSITVTDYVHTMWRWVDPQLGDATPRKGSDFGRRRRALVQEFLAHDEAWVLEHNT